MIKRRIGPPPHADGQQSNSSTGCPDIFELIDGRIAIIGIEATEELRPFLPSDAGCGPDERIVIVDRHVITRAKADLPDE